ncbi:MAG: ABC transporter ATP-binding protein [Devosia sp.]
MARLELDHVDVWLGGQHILRDLSLTVEEGECLALLGPSGCGKTTTLRTVAGFVRPGAGEVRIAGQSIGRTPPNKRNVGIVFQDYALFPHMTVGQNVAYGLEMRRTPAAEIDVRVKEALALVRLADYVERYPTQLSGGQKQRVALARATVIRPDILLLDEPLGALDRKLRDTMQVELKQLQRRLGITTIIVTHDQEEALSLSDRIAVMFEGRLTALGTPESLYEGPPSVKVMEFLGASNTLEGTVERDGEHTAVACAAGVNLPVAWSHAAAGETVRLGIRPEHIALEAAEGAHTVPCTIEEVVYKGAAVDVFVNGPAAMRFHVNTVPARLHDAGLSRGDTVHLSLPARHLIKLSEHEGAHP